MLIRIWKSLLSTPHFHGIFGFLFVAHLFFPSKMANLGIYRGLELSPPSAKQTIILDTSTNPNQILPHTKYKSKDFPTLRHPNTSKYLEPPKNYPKDLRRYLDVSGTYPRHTPDPNHQQLMNNFLNHLELKGHASGIFQGSLHYEPQTMQ